MSGLVVVHGLERRSVDVGKHVAKLDGMLDRISWRGVDHRGRWHDGPTALGAVQLWTTPEDLGSAQPVIGSGSRCVIVFDGRIDNRSDIVADLRMSNVEARRMSDAALVLACYERWSDRCVDRIAGPFSVAIWDARRSRLMLARDALGLRPLYYRVLGRALSTRSEPSTENLTKPPVGMVGGPRPA